LCWSQMGLVLVHQSSPAPARWLSCFCTDESVSFPCLFVECPKALFVCKRALSLFFLSLISSNWLQPFWYLDTRPSVQLHIMIAWCSCSSGFRLLHLYILLTYTYSPLYPVAAKRVGLLKGPQKKVWTKRRNISSSHKPDGLGRIKERTPRSGHVGP
jgi:hypothetical protein